MRLFFAIHLTERTRNSLIAYVRQLQQQNLQATWIRPENYHVTLEFLGEVERLYDVRLAMRRVEGISFCLRFTHCGRFQRRGGDLLWLGIEPSEPLCALQRHLHTALREADFPVEERSYFPHLTLARRMRYKGELSSPQLDPMQVSSFSLMCSELYPDGARYTELERRELRECGC